MPIADIPVITLHTDETGRDGAMNMAIDEALLRASSQPIIRFYGWNAPALSIGYFQSFEEVRRQSENVPIVRRWTGGGIVHHGKDCTFSVIAPYGSYLASLKPSASYELIHRKILEAFGDARLRLAECEDTLSGMACFQSPALHDILADGVKIAGGAQRRTRWGFLHQGSLQQIEVPADFPSRLASQFASKVEVHPLPEDVLAAARTIAAERYGKGEWLTKF